MQVSEYFSKSRSNGDLSTLNNFLGDKRIIIPKGNPHSIFCNQEIGKNFVLHFENQNVYDAAEKALINPITGFIPGDTLDVSEFFRLLEIIRISGTVVKFSEKQVFHLALVPRPPTTRMLDTADIFKDIDYSCNSLTGGDDVGTADSSSAGAYWGEDSTVSTGVHSFGPNQDYEPNATSSSSDADNETTIQSIVVDDSCFDMDFDVIQKTNVRHFNDAEHVELIENIVDIIIPNVISIPKEFHAAVIRKRDVIPFDTKAGRVYKDSFHIRLFLRMPKCFKLFIVKQFNEKEILKEILGDKYSDLINPSGVFDHHCAANPIMFLGSCKGTANKLSEFHKLYLCTKKSKRVIAVAIADFDPIKPETTAIGCKSVTELNSMKAAERNKYIKDQAAAESASGITRRYKYNLCWETSLNFEVPGGFIKKHTLVLRSEVMIQLNVAAQREAGRISQHELDDVLYQVNDLCATDYEARLVRDSLDMLSETRAEDYATWKSIICILARTNIEYKPLAIYFSQRCPKKWINSGYQSLDAIWDWARRTMNNRYEDDDDDESDQSGGGRTVKSLHWMARNDNPNVYFARQETNAHTILCTAAIEHGGTLTENYLAKALQIMHGMKFICDDDSASAGRSGTIERSWYEFIYPSDDLSPEASHFKWRRERHPDTLDKYISDNFHKVIAKVREYIDAKVKERAANSDEKQQKYYELVSKELKSVMTNLGKTTLISKILSRCLIHFRRRNFCDRLDKDGNIIGVMNGILVLVPQTKLITAYNEYIVSRSVNAPYIDGGFHPDRAHLHRSRYVRELWPVITQLFGGRPEVDKVEMYTYVFCYLAACLDGRRKRPLFFIWLGEGSNGKSFLLELFIKMLGAVMARPHGGYAAKLNSSYFMAATKAAGPDSEKMSLKHARFAYCSESDRGAELIMSKIKEFTSETLTGSEKFKTQEMFEALCLFVFCSNYDPRIQGRDYGTWRRILAMYFLITFVDKPDPRNPREVKANAKYIESWVNDRHYQSAFLEILVYYYGLLRDKYGNDLSAVPQAAIKRDTARYQDQQDDISRFITEHVQYVAPADGVKPIEMPLSDLANHYRKHCKGQFGIPTVHTLIADFEKHERLKKYIDRRNNAPYLINHEYVEAKKADQDDFLANLAADAGQSAPTNELIDDPNDLIYDDIDVDVETITAELRARDAEHEQTVDITTSVTPAQPPVENDEFDDLADENITKSISQNMATIATNETAIMSAPIPTDDIIDNTVPEIDDEFDD